MTISALPGWLWSDSIRDNLLVTIAVGGPLGLYLAFVVNRLAAFREIRLSAINEIALIRSRTLATQSCFEGHIIIKWFLETPVIAMCAEEQWETAKELAGIRNNLRSYFGAEFDNAGINKGYHERTQLAGGEWISAQEDVYAKSKLVLRDAVQKIQQLRPNRLRIVGLIPSNRTLDKWDKNRPGRLLIWVAQTTFRLSARWWETARDEMETMLKYS